MKNFIENLSLEMKQKIQELSLTGMAGFEYYTACYKIVKTALIRLKDFIAEYRFKDEKEEISFFKETKPQFQSKLLYFVEFIQIELHTPLVTEKKDLIKYYKRISRHYQLIIERNLGFLEYIRSRLTTNDNLLFVRSEESEDIFHTDILHHEDNFSTPASNELAKIIAYEKVINQLAERIEQLKSGNEGYYSVHQFDLVWTGTKVALTELAYALQASTAINMGKADIRQVVSALEHIFNIDTGNFYRVFQNIRVRQSGRTAFLDELIANLTAKMDELDLNGKIADPE